MEKSDFTSDLDIICSYLRVGASLSDAFDAMTYNQEKRDAFSELHEVEIKQAQAECRILCLHNIFTEGGQSASKYILDNQKLEHEENANAADLENFDFDSL